VSSLSGIDQKQIAELDGLPNSVVLKLGGLKGLQGERVYGGDILLESRIMANIL